MNCSSLSRIYLGNIEFVEPYGCYYMFYGCHGLTTNTIGLTDLYIATDHCFDHMYYYCSRLYSAKLPNAKIVGEYSYAHMYDNCGQLESDNSQSSTYANSFQIPSVISYKSSSYSYMIPLISGLSLDLRPGLVLYSKGFFH